MAGIDNLATRLAALGHLMHAFGIDGGEVQALDRPPQDGPAPRPVLHGATLLLPEAPPAWAALGVALQHDLHLAATLHAIGHLRHSPRRQPTGKRKPMSLALAGAIEDVRVDRLLMRRHPGLGRLFRRLLRSQPGLPQVGFEAMVARLQRVLLDPQADDDNAWVRKGRALFEAQAGRLDDAEALRELVSVLANDLGQLRVRMNLQTYAPPLPWHDDNSHLWAHGADAEQAETTLRRPPPQGAPRPAPPQAPEAAADPAPCKPSNSRQQPDPPTGGPPPVTSQRNPSLSQIPLSWLRPMRAITLREYAPTRAWFFTLSSLAKPSVDLKQRKRLHTAFARQTYTPKLEAVCCAMAVNECRFCSSDI